MVLLVLLAASLLLPLLLFYVLAAVLCAIYRASRFYLHTVCACCFSWSDSHLVIGVHGNWVYVGLGG